jgi:hypothetical protein
MASRSTERWAFLADWQDPNSGVRWTYQLFAYLVPDAHVEVEMVRQHHDIDPETSVVATTKP